MADNEINIKCRICGGTFFIAKRFGLEGYYRNASAFFKVKSAMNINARLPKDINYRSMVYLEEEK